MRKLIFVSSVLLFIACQSSSDSPLSTSDDIALMSEKTNAFFEESFQRKLALKPEQQARMGIKENMDKWNDYSPQFEENYLQITKDDLQYLRDSIDYEKLDAQTKTSYRLFEQNAEQAIKDYKYRLYNYPISQMYGVHSSLPAFLINYHDIENQQDAENYIARVSKIDAIISQTIENLKTREEEGIVLPKFLFPKVLGDCYNLLKGAPYEKCEGECYSTLAEDFRNKLAEANISEETKEELIKALDSALLETMKPAYESLIAYLEAQEKRATNDAGIWKFKDANSFYKLKLQKTTTIDISPDSVFDLGMSEVARIHNEMRQIMEQVDFEGSLQDFFQHMRTSQEFYYPADKEGKEEYRVLATAIIDTMREQLNDYFITKPKAALVVKPVEPFREASAGLAFYNKPSLDGKRPGVYYVNLYDMSTLPKYEMEALAYHEGIPGHHMQLAIALELEGIPLFRKYGHYTAYSEGWGLYCEYLPKEMGFYKDPYSDFGRLSMELWRACRLVADVGIHQKKWTREEAINFYVQNTPSAAFDCERMVDRHIVWPSQATAYKIGMLTILKFREKAKQELGDKFYIREFHDVVLTQGAIPLNLLGEFVDEWIQSKKEG